MGETNTLNQRGHQSWRSLLLGCVACLGGCATGQMIQTTSLPGAPTMDFVPQFKALAAGHGLQGVFYSLPKAIVPITVSVSDGSDSDGKAADAATTSSSNTPNAAPSASTGKKQTSASPSATATASPTINVTMQVSPATASPPKGNVKAPSFKVTATAGLPSLVPDSTENYFLQYRPNNFADDTVSLQADSGLLASSNAQSVDESGAIGGSIVQLAVTIAKLAAGGAGAVPEQFEGAVKIKGHPAPPPPPPVCDLKPLPTTVINFQPGLAADQQDAGPTGSRPGSSFGSILGMTLQVGTYTWLITENESKTESISLEVTSSIDNPDQALLARNTPRFERPIGDGGILFRLPVPWTLVYKLVPNPLAQEACKVAEVYGKPVHVNIPNGGALYFEDMSRAPLVTNKVSLTVKSGMLMGSDITRPSPVLAFVKLPLTIISTALGSVTSPPPTASPSGTATGPSSP